MLYLLYGDFEGGQRVITLLCPHHDNDKWQFSVGRASQLVPPSACGVW